MLLEGYEDRYQPPGLGDVLTDWFPSKEEIDAADNELNAKIHGFAAEHFDALTAAPGLDAPQGWQTRWNDFAQRFGKWHKNTTWHWLTWGRTRRDEYLAFAREFADLVATYKSTGGVTSIVPTAIPKDAGKGPLDALGDKLAGGAGKAAETIATVVKVALWLGVGVLAVKYAVPPLLALRTKRNPLRRRRRRLRRRAR